MLLLLFTTDVDFALTAQAAGIDGIMVDWERRGKADRQDGYDTQINVDTPAHVTALAGRLAIPVAVRINPWGAETRQEIDLALDCGARMIMLPMAERTDQVRQFLQLVDGRAITIVQIETLGLLQQVESLSNLDWDYAYIGLNDLMISRGGSWLWEPLLDGTVESVYRSLPGRKVGFGGVTIVGGGHPIPFLTLLGEMARLGCGMSFLRRMFHRDLADRDLCREIAAVRQTWQALRARGPRAVAADHANCLRLLESLAPNRSPSIPRRSPRQPAFWKRAA